MRIAIIEDRISRLEQYTDFDLRSSKIVKIITGSEFDALMLLLSSNSTEELDQFDCVISHRSALTSEIRDNLKDYCMSKNKPLVFFSGGITSSVFKDIKFPFLHINSKDFYSSNLKLFIETSEQTSSINLLILQFGTMWKLSLLLNLRNKISVSQNKQVLLDSKYIVELDDDEVIKRVRDLDVNSLIKKDLLNEKTKFLLTESEYASISSEQLEDIKSAINQLINAII